MSRRRGVDVILGDLTPSSDKVDAERLTYPRLQSSAEYFDYPSLLLRNSAELIKNFKAYKSSAPHEDIQIAILLMAAHRLQNSWFPPMKLFWSAQLTTRSVALFGQPLMKDVAQIAVSELKYFETIADRHKNKREFFEPLLHAYRSLIRGKVNGEESIEVRYQPILEAVGKHFKQTYHAVLAVFDVYDLTSKIPPEEVVETFQRALHMLSNDDPAWTEWRVVLDDTAKLSVHIRTRTIRIGRYRNPLPAAEIKGLFAHEVLVHAQRSLRGARISEELGRGLPGYLVAEEGLGVIVESAINATISRKVIDRYIDIALALGGAFRLPYTRQDLFAVAYCREVARALDAVAEIDLVRLEQKVWEHINRIYRGSLGNRYVGVFTKDITYYSGFVKMGNYLLERSKKEPVAATIEYLLQGKFDPTVSAHRKLVNKRGD